MLMTGAELDEAARTAIVDRAQKAVKDGGGTWKKVDDWGRRTMAYQINHASDAHYSVLSFEASGDALAEAVRQLRITDGVVRVLATISVPPLPEGADLAEVSDEEFAAGPKREGRPGRGGRGGGGRGGSGGGRR
jgi:small subunit ribosomal protein S6